VSIPGFVQMQIFRMVLDPKSQSPIVILMDPESGALLPIWIGIFEAHAIALKLENIQVPRPMSHDLMRGILDALSARLDRVEVVDLEDNTYIARLCVRVGDKLHHVDSRPSDAMALAIRMEAPIYVADHVLEAGKIDASSLNLESEPEDADDDEWTRILKNYNPPGGREKIN
jgi:bifunctional DNase/RNase